MKTSWTIASTPVAALALRSFGRIRSTSGSYSSSGQPIAISRMRSWRLRIARMSRNNCARFMRPQDTALCLARAFGTAPWKGVYRERVPKPTVNATVEWWSDEEGWGALAESAEMPGGAFVHFSAIVGEGYRSLRAGQTVDARIEGPLSFDQDGYRYRATTVWPLD